MSPTLTRRDADSWICEGEGISRIGATSQEALDLWGRALKRKQRSQPQSPVGQKVPPATGRDFKDIRFSQKPDIVAFRIAAQRSMCQPRLTTLESKSCSQNRTEHPPK